MCRCSFLLDIELQFPPNLLIRLQLLKKVSHLQILQTPQIFRFLLLVEFEEHSRKFLEVLSEAVRVRVTSLPFHRRVGVLFSGKRENNTAAKLITRESENNIENEKDEKSLAKEVSSNFPNDPYASVPDRQTGLLALFELQKLAPNRKWNFVEG